MTLFGVICYFKWVSSDGDLIVLILSVATYIFVCEETPIGHIDWFDFSHNIGEKKKKQRWRNSFLENCLSKASSSYKKPSIFQEILS